MKAIKTAVAVILTAALALGLLSGCGSAPKDLKLEPFPMEWGITEEEAATQLKCKYYTNEKSPGTIYVPNDINDQSLQAFGATPSLIIYEFNLQKEGSDARRLGSITYKFAKDSYDQLLASLEKQCGKCSYEDTQWGTTDSNVYLFEDGILCVEYSSSPLTDPSKVDPENRDRHNFFAGEIYSSQHEIAGYGLDHFSLLWRYSTAETDFVLTDNSK